ncbi:MAG: hypothetical protein PHG08_01085 [Bacilli bacterium]|nr:hypothetical protein [Bacilli bacterium]
MSKIKALLIALSYTKWFFVKSWKFVVAKELKSKIEFFKGVIPAYCRFIIYTYDDILFYNNKKETK